MDLTVPETNDVPVRDAATVIVVRDPAGDPRILMGQRGKTAAFMPDKFVFPGGAVDKVDAEIPLAGTMAEACHDRLKAMSETVSPDQLAVAAIRELWEETGQSMGAEKDWTAAPEGWRDFAAKGLCPDASALRFFFRALTPPGRPRRFDARFFLADAAALTSDPDDFSGAEDELSHLQWVPLARVRELNLPFITRVVLAELEQHLPRTDAPDRVPFVKNDTIDGRVIWL